MKVAEIRKELSRIYGRLPAFKCREKCGECCGPVMWSLAEEIVIRDYLKKRGLEYRKSKSLLDKCPYLTKDKKCEIYEVRPLICRAYGVVEGLECPFVSANKLMSKAEYKLLEEEVSRLSETIAIRLGLIPNPVR